MAPQDDGNLTRRTFTAAAAAAAAAASATEAACADAAEPMDMDVTVKTPDGSCDAAFIHPTGKGTWPAVLVWPDAMGLRPTFREMGRRLAAQGYVVLVVNQFYRAGKAPVMPPPFNFNDPAQRARFMELRAALTNEVVARDAAAHFAWLDAQGVVNKAAKAGVVGYCMGGPMTIQSAAALPDRIGAACSFHGGGLATDKPDSPHLLVPKVKAGFYFGVARNDDQKEPEAKTKLKAAFDAAGKAAKIEVYPDGDHGWCVPDNGSYNKPAAERAWAEMTALYKQKLV